MNHVKIFVVTAFENCAAAPNFVLRVSVSKLENDNDTCQHLPTMHRAGRSRRQASVWRENRRSQPAAANLGALQRPASESGGLARAGSLVTTGRSGKGITIQGPCRGPQSPWGPTRPEESCLQHVLKCYYNNVGFVWWSWQRINQGRSGVTYT